MAVKPSLTVTYRQDWQVLKPTDQGCQPVGGGSATIRGKSEGMHGALRVRGSAGEDDPRVPESLRAPEGLVDETCWTPSLERLRLANIRVDWRSGSPAFACAGTHGVRAVVQMRTQTFRDPVIGDQRQLKTTVSFDLTYEVPAHPRWRRD